MMQMNLTLHHLCRCVVTCFVLSTIVLFPNVLKSQCSLACSGTVQVSLDSNCEAELTPDMVLNDAMTSCPDGIFHVMVEDHYGNQIVFPEITDADGNIIPVIDASLIGEDVFAKILDTESGNSCWGNLIVEDKIPPILACENDTIPCNQISDYVPEVVNNCDDSEFTLVSEQVFPLDCDTLFIKRIDRTYIATDGSGNVSAPCTVSIFLERFDFDTLTCPANFLKVDDTALECSDTFLRDENGHPHPDVTGVPTAYGEDLWPNVDFYCNIGVFYTDLELPTPDCVTKIMRTWEIREWWCNQEIDSLCLQVIEIVDSEGPTITCPNDMTITTNTTMDYNDPVIGHLTCGGLVQLPTLPVSDLCSDEISVTVDFPGGFLYTNGGQAILPMGRHLITYTAYDDCYNATPCTFFIDVVDETAPVAICTQFTTVSLTNDGQAHVYAEVFDNGSYDDCKLWNTVVKRMNPDPCNCEVPHFDGFEYLGDRGGKYYFLSDRAVPGWLAKKEAQCYEGTVAITNTAGEFNWLHAQVSPELDPNEAYYIGLERHYGDFLWADGTPLTFSNWGVGEPNNIGGEENCVEVWPNGDWNDVPCHEEMRYVMEISNVCGFNEFATFCCADIGEETMVIFRTIDYYGNHNDCMVSVEVQDKLAPTISCPPHMIVECTEDFDIDNLAITFGEATASDNCNVMMEETAVFDINQCNLGTITRTFTATDDGGRQSSCSQIIYIENNDPFFINKLNPLDPNDDIVWPVDVTMEGCNSPDDFGPDVTGSPVFLEDECDLVGANFEDEVFTFNTNNQENACFKILRTWTVIDWCQFTNGQYVTCSYTQVIKINNSEDPEITSDCSPVSTCTYDSDCLSGNISLTATATDDCTATADLQWEYVVDANNDGSFDFLPVTGFGGTADASGDYPVGSHRILYTFRDRCGNKISCEQLFSVVNCKAPTPYCLNGLAVDLMPVDTDGDGDIDTGEVELWASDFDAGSYHTCPQYDVVVSFTPDINDKNMLFTCADFGEAQVMIYATAVDPITGEPILDIDGNPLQSFCNTFVDVQDNMGACTGLLPEGRIIGNITTEMEENLEEVSVELEGSEFNATMTDVDGMYAFPSMIVGGSYSVDPTKDINPLNGVSTLDLVLIQRHVLGLNAIESPYKIIAADINKDDKVTAVDLVELRKLILGIYDTYPENESWRFVDRDYTFVDNNPLDEAFPESYLIDNFVSDMTVNFVGVKVGDVNNTAATQLNSGSVIENRSSENLELTTEATISTAGDVILIPVYAKQASLMGMQFTMELNGIQIQNIRSGQLTITEANYAVLSQDVVSFSWGAIENVNVDSNAPIFTIEASAKYNVNIENAIELTSAITRAEAYNVNQEVMDITLNSRSVEQVYSLAQNTPNPFTKNTVIEFVIPTDQAVTIAIHDVSGKLVTEIKGNYSKGVNRVEFDAEEVNAQGILYYSMKSGEFTTTKKMVVIK